MLKQRRDSLQQYETAGRDDLAAQESYEIELIQEYLPPALTDAELDVLIMNTISKVGATSQKEMGKVMGQLKPQVQGRADMNTVSARVKERLASL
jgi:hypothetical protein